MPIDPRELRPSANAPMEVVLTDRPCGKCRYNLKGLPTNGRCPECGYPIGRRGRRGSRRFTDSLVDAPLFYLKTLALGTVLLAVCSIVAGFGFSFLLGGGEEIAAAFAGGASLGWWVGVFIATAQRPMSDNTLRDIFLESSGLRWTNRTIQAAWPLAAMAWFASTRFPGAHDLMAVIGLSLQAVGLLGLIPLSIQLSALGDWAGDTGLAGRFRVTAAAMTICGLFVLAGIPVRLHGITGLGTGTIAVIATWANMGFSLAQLVFLFCLFQLAHISIWAIRNSVTQLEVEQRLAQRALEHQREMAERSARAAAAQTPQPTPRLSAKTAFPTNKLPQRSSSPAPRPDPNRPRQT
jgi:hypothetical protein